MSSSLQSIKLFSVLLLSLLISSAIGQTSCSSTADCKADVEYCSNGSCAQIGSCQEEVDCFNQENSFSSDDCIGYFECKDNQCTKTCSESFCKPESNVGDLFCPTVMCRTEECEGAVSCVNYNCYNCDVLYFDAKGSQICNGNKTLDDEPGAVTMCSSNSDCHKNKTDDSVNIMALDSQPYCADGTCALPGTCATDLDCVNPSNNYEVVFCVGPIICQEGQCARDCDTGSMCKSGVNQVNCFANPCDDSTGCAESTGCVADYCNGGCDAIHFDAKGSQICNGDKTLDEPAVATCSSNSDCHIDIGDSLNKTDDIINIMALDSQPYCAAGTCSLPGTCSTDLDCVNPSNNYGIIECAGPIVCQQGQCTRDCATGSMCKSGVSQSYCLVNPCDVSTGCAESTGCVADYCNGGCDALHFDAAGNVLEECNDLPFEIPESCTRDKECNEEGNSYPTHYCSSGTCKAMGLCNAVTDCFNPSNDAGFATCTGYKQCTLDGECGQVCSTDEHCCFVTVECTAEEKESCPEAVTCVKDNCNDSGDHCGAGAGSFYFDKAGNSICTGAKAPTAAPTAKPKPADTDLADGAKVIGTTLTMMTLMIVTFML